MVLEISLDEFDPDRQQAFAEVKPGRAHVIVTDWEENAINGQWHRMKMEVVAHDEPGENGKIHSELFHAGAKAQWRLIRLALATRLTTVEELAALKEQGEYATFDFADAIGRSMFVRFVQETDRNGEKRIKLGRNLFAIDDPRCSGWPANPGILEREKQGGNETGGDAAADAFGL